jgi:hypothetical protein
MSGVGPRTRCLLCVLLAHVAGAFTVGPDGWTVLQPSADSRIVHVSSSDGADANDGLSPATPVQTIAEGMRRLRDGYPDHLLLKRGDTWHEAFGFWSKSGRSAGEPMVVGSYGASSARPRVIANNEPALRGLDKRIAYFAFTGMHLQVENRPASLGPTGIRWLAPTDQFLIEDCLIEGFSTNVVVQGYFGAIENFQIRRCVVIDAFDTTALSQGMYCENVDGILIEECVFDYNGWKEGVYAQTMLNHNVYIHAESKNLIARGNIFSRSSSHGLQARPGGIVENNLFVRCPVSCSYGYVLGGSDPTVGGVGGVVRGNVMLEGNDIGDKPRGIGIQVGNIAEAVGLELSGNYFVRNDSSEPFGAAIELQSGNGLGIHNTLIAGNVCYGYNAGLNAEGVTEKYSTTEIRENYFIPLDSYSFTAHHRYALHPERVAYAGNVYNSPRSTNSWFRANSVLYSFPGWQGLSLDETGVAGEGDFPDSSRSLQSYSALQGFPGTVAGFLSEARKQSRQHWRPQCSAGPVIEYIRVGFGGREDGVDELPRVYTVTAVPSDVDRGVIEPFQGSAAFVEAEEVTLRAVPHAGWQLDRWEGDINGSSNPVTFTVTSDIRAVAVFTVKPPETYTVTVAVQGQGSTSPAAGTTTAPAGATIVLTATPASGWLFDRWQGALTTSANPASLLVDGDKAVTAVFVPKPKTVLGTSVVGQGSIGVSPAGGEYDVGTVVTLSASPAVGWQFLHWQGDVSGSANPTKVTMDVNKNVTAVFVEVVRMRLTVDTEGQGSIVLDPPGGGYDYGTVVGLTATPAVGWRFARWEGDLSGSANPSTITMNGTKNVRAVFVILTGLRLTAEAEGQGSIGLDPPGGAYDYGTVVGLTATPAAGWRFEHWEGDLSGPNPGQVTMTQAHFVRAVFVPLPSRTLTTEVRGQGTVTLLPSGGTYPDGTLVSLSASSGAGWRFDRWEGALGGTENPKLLRLDSDKHVIAVFLSSGGNQECSLAVIAPADNTTVFARDAAAAIPFTIVVEPSCPDDTLWVELKVDGVSLGVDTTPPFTGTVADLGRLSAGPHLIEAIATAADGVRTVSVTSAFTLVFTDPAVDVDGNGLPDDPFRLLGEGDTWVDALPESGARNTAAVLWTGGAGTHAGSTITAAFADPRDPERHVVVTVPPTVALAGETAVLLVAASEDLAAILEGDVASLFDTEPSPGLLPGGQYVGMSILITTDGGATFDELDPARLLTTPVQLRMGGFEFGLVGIETFFTHPTFVEGGYPGVRVIPEIGGWSDAGTLNVAFEHQGLRADLTALSVSAPYFRAPSAPVIGGITPNSGSVEGGTRVVISGTGLNGPTEVRFGGVPAAVESSRDAELVVVTPPHVEGVVAVTIATDNGSDTRLSGFTYLSGIEAPAALLVSPLGHTFGPVPVGTTRTKSFVVENTGDGFVSGSASIDAPFRIESGGTYDLGPAESQTLIISFSPQALQEYQGTLTFTGTGKTANFTLRGTGAPAPTTGAGCAAPRAGGSALTGDVACVVVVLVLLLGAATGGEGREGLGEFQSQAGKISKHQ